MKFIHISDLHFGKNLGNMPLLNDQEYWVDRFLDLCREEKPQAIIVAGDVYDRSLPSAEAVALCDRFVTGISSLGIPLLITSGNHDSGTRLSFAGKLLALHDVHIAGEILREMQCVTLNDAFGPVNFYMMPFIYPVEARRVLGNESIHSYEDAVRELIAAQAIDPTARNIMIAHQNVTLNGSEMERGGSETAVGGVDGVDVHVFDPFDYVALGHIHAAYEIGRDTVRYCGSPLCYHFDESLRAEKGPLIVTMNEKGTPIDIRCAKIEPLHRMVVLRGNEAELTAAAMDPSLHNMYVKAVLTGERMTAEISEKITAAIESHPNCIRVQITSEYAEHSAAGSLTAERAHSLTNAELFADYYRNCKGGADPTEQDEKLFNMIEDICRTEYGEKDYPTDEAVDRLIRFIRTQEENA